MADPINPQPTGKKWLWPLIIALFAVVLLIVLLNPSGERDGTVQDPIVMEDTGEGVGVGQAPTTADDAAPAPEPFAPGGEPSE